MSYKVAVIRSTKEAADMRLVLSAVALVCVGVSGCGREVARGQQLKLRETVGIYFAAEDDKYHPLSREEVDSLLKGAVWLSPDGIELVERKVDVSKTNVTWMDGSHQYICEGADIRFNITAKIKEDCPTGTYRVMMILPAVKAISGLSGTKAMVLYDKHQVLSVREPETVAELSAAESRVPVVTVGDITVHATSKAASLATLKNVMIAIAVIIGLIVLLLILARGEWR